MYFFGGRTDRATGADGIFPPLCGKWFVAAEAENLSINTDSLQNRADSESSKFPFEFKSPNF